MKHHEVKSGTRANERSNLVNHRPQLLHGQRLVPSLLHEVKETLVQKFKFQTNTLLMEERAVPSYNVAFVWIQSLQARQDFQLWEK